MVLSFRIYGESVGHYWTRNSHLLDHDLVASWIVFFCVNNSCLYVLRTFGLYDINILYVSFRACCIYTTQWWSVLSNMLYTTNHLVKCSNHPVVHNTMIYTARSLWSLLTLLQRNSLHRHWGTSDSLNWYKGIENKKSVVILIMIGKSSDLSYLYKKRSERVYYPVGRRLTDGDEW